MTGVMETQGLHAKKAEIKEEDCKLRESRMMYLAILITTLGAMCFGFALGYSSPTLVDTAKCTDWDNADYDTNRQSLNCRMGLTDKKTAGFEAKDWFGSIVNLGAAGSALFGGVVANRFGLKVGMCVGYSLFLLGYLLLFFTPKPDHWRDADHCDPAHPGEEKYCTYKEANVAMLLVSRVIIGFGAGFVTCCCPPYLNEVATTKVRGAAGACFQVGCVLGLLLAYLLGIPLRFDVMALIAAILAGLCFLTTLLVLPGSPRWLAARGRKEEAIASLKKLRAAAEGSDFDEELDKLYGVMLREKGSDNEGEEAADAGCADLCGGNGAKALFITVALMVIQQFSGINAVMFYSGGILSDVFPDSTSTANKYALGIQCLQVVITITAAPLMDKAGRRLLLIIAQIGMIISCVCLSSFYLNNDQHSYGLRCLAVVSLYGYVFSFSCGLGAIPWAIIGELSPITSKGSISAIVTQVSWLSSFVITATLDSLTKSFGAHGKDANGDDKFQNGRGIVFMIYCAFCVVGLIVTILIVPETKGKSIAHVQRELARPGLMHCGQGIAEDEAKETDRLIDDAA